MKQKNPFKKRILLLIKWFGLQNLVIGLYN